MAPKILKAGLMGVLGIIAALFLLGMLSFFVPPLGGWVDGLPLGAIAAVPKLLLGGIGGIVVGALIGERLGHMEIGAFAGAIASGILGVLIIPGEFYLTNIFMWTQFTYYILMITGIALSLFAYPRNPRKFTLSAIAFSIFFLISLYPQFFPITPDTAEMYSLASMAFGVSGWIILMIALFAEPRSSDNRTGGQEHHSL